MANKFVRRRYSKTPIGHYYRFGDFLFKPNESGLVTNRSLGNMSDLGNGLVLAAGSSIGLIGGSLISGGYSSGAGNVFQGLSNIASAIPGPWGAVASAGLGLIGGATNRLFGSKMNAENISKVESNIASLNAFLSNASDFDTLSLNWANADIGMTFKDSYIGKDGIFSSKAKNKAADLRKLVEAGNTWVLNTLANNAENISDTQMQNLLGNYAAYGGHLFSKGGGIHIKPENRGKFNALKKRTGKTTEELTHSKNPLTRKRAIFALNAKKWKHDDGGPLNDNVPEWLRSPGGRFLYNGYNYLADHMEDIDTFVDAVEPTIANIGTGASIGSMIAPNPITLAIAGGANILGGGIDIYQGIRGGMKGDWKNVAKNTVELGLSLAGAKSLKQARAYSAMPRSGLTVTRTIGRGAGRRKITKPIEVDRAQNKYLQYGTIEGIGTISNNTDINAEPSYRHISNNPFGLYTILHEDSEEGNEKAFGGELGTNGADFTNGIIEINSGGTHELNPNEGVIFGMDLEGIPNLVEEGEVIFGDYVYSNRIKVPKTVRKRHRLTDGVTFADAAKELAKESEERPNDPISLNGLNYLMNDLMTELEMIKSKLDKNKFSKGGRVNKYPNGTSDLGLYDLSINMGDFSWMEELNKLSLGKKTKTKSSNIFNTANLRYVPAIGATIGTISSLTGKPDYETADMVLEASRGMGTAPSVRFNPIGNYLTYNPFDRDYYINKLNAQAGATRRNILNTSGGNRGAAMAGIIAADNNYLGQLGSLARQAEEYNLAQRQQVENFNRATNQYNSEGSLKADIANAENRLKTANLRMEGIITAAKMRLAAKDASDLSKSTNLTNLFDSLGNIGWEEYNRNGIPGFLGYTRDRVGNVVYTGGTLRKKGGYLLTNRKGRRK